MKNKKGFTLIELLAVIIILGILMIIAIPSVTSYINNSRKSAYVNTAKKIISGARNMVNQGNLGMYDTNTTYYIPSSLIKTEGGEAQSPYGKLDEAYVGVTFNGKGYNYYWISKDDTGQGFKELSFNDKLAEEDIVSDIENGFVDNYVKTNAIGCNKNIKILNTNSTWNDYVATDYSIDENIFNKNDICPNCVFARPSGNIFENTELNIQAFTDYKNVENYDSIPFFGFILEHNVIKKIYLCAVADERLLCISDIKHSNNYDCNRSMIAKFLDIDKYAESYDEYANSTESICRKNYLTYSSSDSVPNIECKSYKYGYKAVFTKDHVFNIMLDNNYICFLQISYANTPNEIKNGRCMYYS